MRLDELVTGPIYLDTNILYMYLRSDPAYLPSLKGFLRRIVTGEIEAFIGVPVFDELYYRLLLAQVRDATGRHPINELREHLSDVLTDHGATVADAIHTLLTLPHIHPVGVEISEVEQMIDNIQKYSLLPRDALHLAIMQRIGVSAIASDDRDFDKVAGCERYWLVNPPVVRQK
jgi:predicted nucleic acid-binding protein